MPGDEVTVAAVDVAKTAAQLIRDGECTGQCLTAASRAESCDGCPCRGVHHGKLADTAVADTRRETKPAPLAEQLPAFDITQPAPAGDEQLAINLVEVS